MIQIKEFSEKSGISIRMLRYLEEQGLLLPFRGENNYRYYNESQYEIAEFIKSLQNLGFQLKEIKELQDPPGEEASVVSKVLEREKEIAEIKSDSIPYLRYLVDQLNTSKKSLIQLLKTNPEEKKMKTMGGEEKFQRVAYSIPLLKTIYEDHIEKEADIELVATDLMKFGQWYDELKSTPQVFSILSESSFAFGVSVSESFIEGYKKAWKQFLPDIGLGLVEDFTKEDVGQLMGIHEIIIRTEFKYKDGTTGFIVIPYTPIFTMTRLKSFD
jgi:DNA-binding transcriptional MerR regulator